MQHLTKLYPSGKESRHLLSCLDQLLVPDRHWSLINHAVFKTYHLGSRMTCGDTHYTSRDVTPAYFGKISNKPLLRESMKWTFAPITFPMYASVRNQQTRSANHSLKEVKAKTYVTLYSNKHVRIMRMMCFSAKISSFLCLVGAPICFGAVQAGMLELEAAMNLSAMFACYTILLTGQSFLVFSRCICIVMISTDDSYLQISHLSLFGNRRNLYVKTTDVKPINGSVYQYGSYKVQFINSSRKLIFRPRDGKDDTNYEALESIFGRSDQQKT